MSGVIAKFFVQEVTRTTSGGTVKLGAVCRGEDNKSWAKYTPAGQIILTTVNEDALKQFEPGTEFYVTFAPAVQGQEG